MFGLSKSTTVSIIFAAGLALPTSAYPLTVTSIEGVWQNTSAGVSGEGTSEIRWGRPAGQGKSGYNFNAAGTSLETVPDTSFVLGTFSHLNFPVYGPFLERVDLAVSFTIEGLSSAFTSVFSFAHDETLNGAARCAAGAAGVGVNVNGCADHVMATLNERKSESFTLDGVEYVLDVSGLLHDGALMTDFWTVENAENSAQLLAEFRVVDSQIPITTVPPSPIPPTSPPPSLPEVPLPASGWLLLAAVAGLIAKGRRL